MENKTNDIPAIGASMKPHWIAKSKQIKQQFIADGFVKTNFGWIHKDWINYGLKNNLIGKPIEHKDGSFEYPVKVKQTQETVYGGSGRTKTEEIKYKLSKEPALQWFKYIEFKRGHVSAEEFKSYMIDVNLSNK